jgi:hypothetical protein
MFRRVLFLERSLKLRGSVRLYLIGFIGISLSAIGCGIANYPYLVPPEPIAVGIEGFEHQTQENPAFFLGYEIYYRIYDTPQTETELLDDLVGIFSDRSGFDEVSKQRARDDLWSSGETTDVENPYWLAAASNPEESGNSTNPIESELFGINPPLLPIKQSYSGNQFNVLLNVDSLPLALVIEPVAYPEDAEFPDKIYLYRRVKNDSGAARHFTDTLTDYNPNEHVDIPENATGDLFIAFFVVIYGYDDTDFTEIFANSHLGRPKENVLYMGSLTVTGN